MKIKNARGGLGEAPPQRTAKMKIYQALNSNLTAMTLLDKGPSRLVQGLGGNAASRAIGSVV
ncbi:MAG: hypothetical protein C5B49_05080 [Bdellovibrio sp.]|nr:MAG: hypothetical protein C5B49_05080 [Bdellovibrio sp.]